jgi:two-component system chemotaxis response regulator CheB
VKPIRVLIVDDSATIRSLLTAILSRDPGIEVVGAAPEPAVARTMIKELNPDVLTLDVEMPNMNGLEFLEKLMRLRPMPVVMVSTLTERGTEVALDALALGALDCVGKPARNTAQALDSLGPELIEKVKTAASAQVHALVRNEQRATPLRDEGPLDYKIIAIGSSTGGVEALLDVLTHFPANCPPTVITQHMPAGFTRTFAQRLDKLCAPQIAEAFDGAPLEMGRIYLAPGGVAHLEVGGHGHLRCRLSDADPVNNHRPSADVLFHSTARAAGADAIGVILTGMGRDGVKGLLAMREAGAMTIGQDQSTSVVYGMPRVAFEAGAVVTQLPIEKIGREIIRHARSSAKRRA